MPETEHSFAPSVSSTDDSPRPSVGCKLALNITASSTTPNAKVALRVAAMTQELKDILSGYEKLAYRNVAEKCEWLVEEPTVKTMAEELRNSAFGKIRGVPDEDGHYVLV